MSQCTRNLKRQGTGKTDIFGFLAVASEKFALTLTGNKAKPMMIMASDLQDNVRRRPDLNLASADLVIAGYQVIKSPKKTQELKKKWRRLLKKAGGASTMFIRNEEKFDLNNL